MRTGEADWLPGTGAEDISAGTATLHIQTRSKH